MSADKAPANLNSLWDAGGGDTGRRRAERMSFSQLSITYLKCENRAL
ncbi:MAG: hypothetical protein ACE5H4_02945 [Candidatus Thorarchaeota archaeon]